MIHSGESSEPNIPTAVCCRTLPVRKTRRYPVSSQFPQASAEARRTPNRLLNLQQKPVPAHIHSLVGRLSRYKQLAVSAERVCGMEHTPTKAQPPPPREIAFFRPLTVSSFLKLKVLHHPRSARVLCSVCFHSIPVRATQKHSSP